MDVALIFIWIFVAMVALSFVEAYVEGRNPWHHRKVGWKIGSAKEKKTKWKNIIGNFIMYKDAEVNIFPGYHFFLFVIMLPLLITLPLVIEGFDLQLLGVLISAYFSGIVLEDFTYFIVNPKIKFSEWNPEFVNFFPWVKILNFNIPANYILGVLIAFVSYWFLWS